MYQQLFSSSRYPPTSPDSVSVFEKLTQTLNGSIHTVISQVQEQIRVVPHTWKQQNPLLHHLGLKQQLSSPVSAVSPRPYMCGKRFASNSDEKEERGAQYKTIIKLYVNSYLFFILQHTDKWSLASLACAVLSDMSIISLCWQFCDSTETNGCDLDTFCIHRPKGLWVKAQQEHQPRLILVSNMSRRFFQFFCG